MNIIDINPASDSDDGIANDLVNDDIVQPFQLESSALRGRLVRLGPVLDNIIGNHDYPKAVSMLLAEMITLSLLLSSLLKYEGVFTLQTSSDGLVSMLVADVTSEGHVRACAKFDESKIKGKTTEDILGKGHIAFTVDQGSMAERYQGIVSIQNGNLEDSIHHYFAQSEQIGTGLKIKIGHDGRDKNTGWRAGAIMLQHLPEEGGKEEDGASKDLWYKEDGIDIEEDWRRANILLDSCKDKELLSESLDGNNLLIRLFHEEGVRVFTPINVIQKCRCSKQRTENILKSLDESEYEDLAKDNKIEMICEFCSRKFEFDLG